MRTETEVRGRIEYWKSILAGVLKGEQTKKTLRHIIKELEWVLEKGKYKQSETARYCQMLERFCTVM
jgi:hypothetical protein